MIFDRHCIVKNMFDRCVEPVNTNKLDIKKIMLSKKDSYVNKGAFKHFIGYISNSGNIPLYIILPQMNAYVKYFDKNNRYINILVSKNIMKYGIKLKVYLKKI